MIQATNRILSLVLATLVAALAAGPVFADDAAPVASDQSAAPAASSDAKATPASTATGTKEPAAAEKPVAEKPAGQEAAAAEKPAAEEPAVSATVKETAGTAEWRPSAEAPWQAIKAGDKIPVGADIRTGFRAKCLLVFADESSVVEVQPLTTMRVGEFEKQGDKVRTRLYLNQGSTRSSVEKGRLQSDFAIVTPEVTMAVRGTQGIETRRYADKGPIIGLIRSGLLHVSSNKSGHGQNIHPGQFVGQRLLPPIQNTQFTRIIRVFDLHGGLTWHEQFAILRQPLTVFGTPRQNAPNGQPGGQAPRNIHQNNTVYQQFFASNPTRVPGQIITPPPPPNYTPPDHCNGGSGIEPE